MRADAARALGDFGNRYRRERPAVEPLIPGPDDGNRTLVRPADGRAVETLIRALSDDHASVREWAARSLGNFNDPRSVAPLAQRLSDDDLGVRQWAARSLGAMRDTGAVQPLIDLVGEQRASVREWFLRALGSLHDRRAATAFLDALDSDDPTIREWAIRGWGAPSVTPQRSTRSWRDWATTAPPYANGRRGRWERSRTRAPSCTSSAGSMTRAPRSGAGPSGR